MRALIAPNAYVDPLVFAHERERVFESSWQFVGLRRELDQPGDYLTTQLGRTPVLIRNFDGVLRAFLNVCSHRHCQILGDRRGNGPLRCPYHGWGYNQDGIPYSIPSRPRFDDLTKDVVASLRLTSFQVDQCGEFVFVGPVNAPPLADYLAGGARVLERVSGALGVHISTSEVAFQSNWKVAIENTLESYHVGAVHPETFARLGAKGMNFEFYGPHSLWTADLAEAVTAQSKAIVPFFEPRRYPIEGYLHLFIFPNLTVASTFGTSFSVQRFMPMDVGATQLTTEVFWAVDGTAKVMPVAAREHMGKAITAFNARVFDEDKVICEAVQHGLRHSTQPGLLSDEEGRVSAFQEACCNSGSYLHTGAPDA